MRGLALIAACCALGVVAAAAATSSSTLARCGPGQLELTSRLQGATQSLLGTVVVANRSARACALPVAPSRVTLVIGTQVLPALTVRMASGIAPSGTPTRRLPARGRVTVGVQWRNWCGAPRGNVSLRVGLTIYSSETSRVTAGVVRTPVCVDHDHSSRVAVSRFIASA
jgi:hypothetical protein